jgi:multimeric flavodoxin WrbA
MAGNGVVLGFVGSPNKDGRTNQLITAALEGAAQAGATTEIVHMGDYVVNACKDCLPWVCLKNLKCTYEDEAFEVLSDKILNCGAFIFGSPVYWWDTSGIMKYFILKMFRIYAMSAPLKGLPAFGIAIAGGTGNGLISGLQPVYHFLQMMQMRALDPVPATRFNFGEALDRSKELGGQIAAMRHEREPFTTYDEGLVWYDNLPYLGMNRFEERRLLAAQVTSAIPEESRKTAALGLAKADMLAAAGRTVDALNEIAKVYVTGIKVFNRK